MAQLQAPTPDDVFLKWLNQTSTKELKKLFGVDSKKAISAAEYVKDVKRGVLFHFKTVPTSAPRAERTVVKTVTDQVKVLEKVEFFSVTSPVSKASWKYKDKVPDSRSIQLVQCSKCRGKGSVECKVCKGKNKITCTRCKGSGRESCDQCNNTRQVVISVTIRDEHGRKTEKKMRVQCPQCHGEGGLTCKDCGGVGEIPCPNCHGRPEPCKECVGHGTLVKYDIISVPFTADSEPKDYLFVSKQYNWILKDKTISSMLQDADFHEIQSLDKLTEKAVMDYFGVPKLEKAIEEPFKNCKKTFEALLKDHDKKKSDQKPQLPIHLYFVQLLAVETGKKKKFELLSIGSKGKFIVLKR